MENPFPIVPREQHLKDLKQTAKRKDLEKYKEALIKIEDLKSRLKARDKQDGKIKYLERRLTKYYDENREATTKIEDLKKKIIQRELKIIYDDTQIRGLIKSLDLIANQVVKHIPEYLIHITNKKGA